MTETKTRARTKKKIIEHRVVTPTALKLPSYPSTAAEALKNLTAALEIMEKDGWIFQSEVTQNIASQTVKFWVFYREG